VLIMLARRYHDLLREHWLLIAAVAAVLVLLLSSHIHGMGGPFLA
jgi:hypothetical protein